MGKTGKVVQVLGPVVDVTNYVMMDLGQPMHGFDFDKLDGGIRVRLAEAGEKLVLLDHSEVECRDNTLLIADHSGAVALAGIMGGLYSSVQAETRNILLVESCTKCIVVGRFIGEPAPITVDHDRSRPCPFSSTIFRMPLFTSDSIRSVTTRFSVDG